jgi:hypothetical protein
MIHGGTLPKLTILFLQHCIYSKNNRLLVNYFINSFMKIYDTYFDRVIGFIFL